jgi:hypothetical protein
LNNGNKYKKSEADKVAEAEENQYQQDIVTVKAKEAGSIIKNNANYAFR